MSIGPKNRNVPAERSAFGRAQAQPAIERAAPRDLGWTVALSGTGVNLALGILYSWSVISKAIPAQWGWSEADKAWPYSVALVVFALMMVPAGLMQDRIGPRVVASIGGMLFGIGMVLASFTQTPIGYIFGFGILAGAGIGFGYASATPPAVKWFSPARTGLIAGIVVSGFGLASVYTAPLSNWLSSSYGLQSTLLILAVIFFVVVVGLAQLLKAPPPGFVTVDSGKAGRKGARPARTAVDYSPGMMLRTPQFYLLWFMYACGAGAGLMIISKLSKIATDQAGVSLGFVFVAILAIGNGAGRILAGFISDRIGRTRTLLACFVFQAALIGLLSLATTGSLMANAGIVAILAALMGAMYGANLSLFPSAAKDWYGLKNFGINYGLLFTAWGIGGFALSQLMGTLYDHYHSFNYAYYVAVVLLLISAGVTFITRAPRRATRTL